MTDSPIPEIDVEAQEDLRDALGDEDFDRLVEIFRDSLPARIQEISQAILADDAITMARASHAMKGAAANLGFSGLAQLFSSLETKGKANDLTGTQELCAAARSGSMATFPQLRWS